jgi:hypothetical protein
VFDGARLRQITPQQYCWQILTLGNGTLSGIAGIRTGKLRAVCYDGQRLNATDVEVLVDSLHSKRARVESLSLRGCGLGYVEAKELAFVLGKMISIDGVKIGVQVRRVKGGAKGSQGGKELLRRLSSKRVARSGSRRGNGSAAADNSFGSALSSIGTSISSWGTSWLNGWGDGDDSTANAQGKKRRRSSKKTPAAASAGDDGSGAESEDEAGSLGDANSTSNTVLRSLDLTDNPLTLNQHALGYKHRPRNPAEGVKALSSQLAADKSLTLLDLSNCRLGEALLDTHLNIGHNDSTSGSSFASSGGGRAALTSPSHSSLTQCEATRRF